MWFYGIIKKISVRGGADKMRKILAWLDAHKIRYTVKTEPTGISIPLETGLVWVNGFGEEMMWDRKIWVTQDSRKKYHAWASIGYNRSEPIIQYEGRQDKVCEAIDRYRSNCVLR